MAGGGIMPTTYRVIFDNPDINTITGHHTIEAVIEEFANDGSMKGVKEKYGISLAEINSRFSGSVDKWLAWVGRDMLTKHKSRHGVHTELMSKRGVAIEVS
jgi:hypothetical protein